ncbi:MAG TPA: SIMPL domain-containing protein [Mariniphaga sp.]|nr:SIMPL domain-containing protein [Mariniphaga sp.]
MTLKYLTFFLILLITFAASAQDNNDIRYIEVRGTAEKEIEPDEMMLFIGIQEYWEEEFEKRKEPKDYRTKVPLEKIEDSVLKSLYKAGISKEDIRVGSIGNYWREQGKEFLFSKQLQVKIKDFAKVNQLISFLDSKGIRNMSIGGFDHSDIESIKKQVKADALEDARIKAEWLLNSIDEELGEVLAISEISDGYIRPFKAESRMLTADAANESVDQVQKITITYQINAKFRIK